MLSDNRFMMSNMSRNKTQTALMNTLGYFGENDSCVEILQTLRHRLRVSLTLKWLIFP